MEEKEDSSFDLEENESDKEKLNTSSVDEGNSQLNLQKSGSLSKNYSKRLKELSKKKSEVRIKIMEFFTEYSEKCQYANFHANKMNLTQRINTIIFNFSEIHRTEFLDFILMFGFNFDTIEIFFKKLKILININLLKINIFS